MREHAESENRHDFETTLATFHHPRYEHVATGEVIDGEAAVRAYFQETRAAFPDQRNQIVSLHHADDAVILEIVLRGTHLGSYKGLPPTGRAFECRVVAIFDFDGPRLICERTYFDAATILRQLGLSHDPKTLKGRLATVLNHPLTIGRAALRGLLRRERSDRG